MDTRLNTSKPTLDSKAGSKADSKAGPNTEPKDDPTSSTFYTSRGLKRQLKLLTSDSLPTHNRQILSPVETYSPEERINDRSVTSPEYFFYSKANNPIKMNPWCTQFECIYRSLAEENHLEVEARVNDLSDVQIKSLPIISPSGKFLDNLQIPGSLFNLASISREAGKIFFRVLFDRLTPEQLRIALSEPIGDKRTLLYYACRLMDEPLFSQLEQKTDRQTLLEMVTRPFNHQAPPLACACLYSDSNYLFDTVIRQDRELAVKLLKGGPDIDQTLLQFMCNDEQSRLSDCLLSIYEHRHRIRHLLNTLNKQDRFDAVAFTGKSNKSALLWACTKSRDIDMAIVLTESLDDEQKAELCTAKAKEGNSLVQKCLACNETYRVTDLCMSIHDPLLRYKVLSVCTSVGHSLFQQWLHHPVDIDIIKKLLRDMEDNHRALLIAGDRRIWEQAPNCPDPKYMTMCFSDLLQSLCGLRDRNYTIAFGHLVTLRQQRQTPIIYAMNRKNIPLAKFLLEQIADPVLQTKLLLYKTENETNLLQQMFDNEAQWHYLKKRLKKTNNPIERDLLAIELFNRAMAAGLFTDADNYSKQLSDPQIKHHLLEKNHKYYLLDHCRNGKTITEDFFSGQTPSRCTTSVVYALEHTLYNEERLIKSLEDPLMASLPQLLTVQKKVGHKDNFVTWATSLQQGKQCPLITAMKRFAVAYCEINNPLYFLPGFNNRNLIKMEASLNIQIFQGMMSMMSEEQIKAFFLSLQHSLQDSLQEKSSNTLHLLGYKDILATTVDTLGDSGRAFLEQINPASGGNILHTLFENRFTDFTDIKLNGLIETLDWLDKTYGLTPFLQGHLEDDGSTPLHALLATAKKKSKRTEDISPMVQEHILKRLCQPDTDGIPLVGLLQLKDHNGCTPLHKFFSCSETNEDVGGLLIKELGLETFYELVNIKDKQGTTAMDHCSQKHGGLYKEYNGLFRALPAAVYVQDPGAFPGNI
ncbi:hypothetical protein [Endozoicomonas sp. SESOKO1]|uniref:hypothetical protein n=1 Tax=Endozoicomonas sp. SESOKO1 TaxID=2828742 RepID=UPI002148160E|nr:hypothetical protein [Endozoicomonas sp. SESOKO1]